jgi:hypothetical protein
MLLVHWWNGSWGRLTRRDVWLEQLDDGRLRVRWRGGAWRDRDGRYVTRSPKVATAVCRALLGDDLSQWRELPVQRQDPGPAT